jgi:hypothetical protein
MQTLTRRENRTYVALVAGAGRRALVVRPDQAPSGEDLAKAIALVSDHIDAE